MFTEIILAIILGVLSGVVTGIIPGIHVNLVAVMLASSTFYVNYNPVVVAIYIISLALTHTFLDSIPTIFLGAPDADMALSILPGHKMLLMGKGYEAVKLTVTGSYLCLLGTIFAIPLIIPHLGKLYAIIQPYMVYFLIAVGLIMVLTESGLKKFLGLYTLLQAGILGLVVFQLPLRQPLFPLFTGLFGISTLLLSLSNNVKIPEQKKVPHVRVGFLRTLKAVIIGIFAGSLTGLLPAIGAAQASLIGMLAAGKRFGKRAFLILFGGTNTVNFSFSIATVFALGKARNGAIIAVMDLVEINLNILILFLITSLIAGSIAVFLTLGIAKIFSKIITKINYTALVVGIMLFISIMVVIISGFLGLLVLLISTFIGMIPVLVGVKRSHNMGCLLIPVILYLLL